MAAKSDDKNVSWREKYLDALDQQEQIEKTFAAQQELLRRALVRVSISADGQDEALDTVLAQLRERMRSGAITNDIASLIAQLDDVAQNFEQHRDQHALDVRQSLAVTLKSLQDLELSRSAKKDIKKYLDHLPLRSKKVHMYPALLKELADIQQQALKEIAQPKQNFLQKILGPKNENKSNTLADEKSRISAPSLDTETQRQTTTPSSTEFIKAPLNQGAPAAIIQAYHDQESELSSVGAAMMRNGVIGNQSLSSQLPATFVDRMTRVIHQFLISLEKETPLAKKVQAIRARITQDMTADVFISTLEMLRDLVMQAYLYANQAFASYLKNVNQELADIYGVVSGATETEKKRQDASTALQDAVTHDMLSLEETTESATDLAQLKAQVRSQIGSIRSALSTYTESEKLQDQLASQLGLLAEKIKVMESEAEVNRKVLEKQRHKALHDPLTELPNREYYNERSLYEFNRWQRYGRPLTIAIFDIDFFKKINDNYGHQAGDKVLKVIGQSIAKRLREVDFFCRFGGEEFVALMPETRLEDALQLLDTIRGAIANAAFNYKEQSIAITLSIGATEFKKGDDIESAFGRADQAVYAAKDGGRNCVKTA